ncbi:MAG: nucleoside hydrolase, partial [Gemmataceae bacterium]
ELPGMIDTLIFVGGAYREPGNAGPHAEFHAWLDPDSTRAVLQAGLHPIVIPLDVTRRLILSPTELLTLPNPDSRTGQFLRQVLPYAIRTSSHQYGIEGFHLKDVLGIAAAALPGCLTLEPKVMDVETRGELTRGMTVVDERKTSMIPANVRLATDAAIGEIRQWIERILRAAR